MNLDPIIDQFEAANKASQQARQQSAAAEAQRRQLNAAAVSAHMHAVILPILITARDQLCLRGYAAEVRNSSILQHGGPAVTGLELALLTDTRTLCGPTSGQITFRSHDHSATITVLLHTPSALPESKPSVPYTAADASWADQIVTAFVASVFKS